MLDTQAFQHHSSRFKHSDSPFPSPFHDHDRERQIWLARLGYLVLQGSVYLLLLGCPRIRSRSQDPVWPICRVRLPFNSHGHGNKGQSYPSQFNSLHLAYVGGDIVPKLPGNDVPDVRVVLVHLAPKALDLSQIRVILLHITRILTNRSVQFTSLSFNLLLYLTCNVPVDRPGKNCMIWGHVRRFTSFKYLIFLFSSGVNKVFGLVGLGVGAGMPGWSTMLACSELS